MQTIVDSEPQKVLRRTISHSLAHDENDIITWKVNT